MVYKMVYRSVPSITFPKYVSSSHGHTDDVVPPSLNSLFTIMLLLISFNLELKLDLSNKSVCLLALFTN